MGLSGLSVFAVGASAPTAALIAGVGQTYSQTGVTGVPLSYLLLAVALYLLTIGYLAMNGREPSAAPFYILLARGLGRPWGVAGGVLALVGYNAVEISLFGFAGGTLRDSWGGPWWAWAAGPWLLIGWLGLRRVDISAKVLTGVLATEFSVIALIDVVAFTHPAGGKISFEPLEPGNLFVGAAFGLVLAFGVAAFIGFETGTSFGEEAREDRNIPRATKVALCIVTPVYLVSAWAVPVWTGPGNVQAAARLDPTLPFTILSQELGVFGNVVASIGKFLLYTSLIGAGLSFHGTISRIAFAMARDGLLPKWLERTGNDDGSQQDAPVAASLIQTAFAGLVIAVVAAAGWDPITGMFTWFATLAAVAVITLLTGTSGASVRWFHAGNGGNENIWIRQWGPGLGIVAGVTGLIVVTIWMPSLLGTSTGAAVIPLVVSAAIVAGLCWAWVLRSGWPAVYADIGKGRPHQHYLPDPRLRQVKWVRGQ